MKEASINISRDDMESSICNDELQGIFLEEEVRELRNRLTIEMTKSKRLMKVIEKKVLERQKRYNLILCLKNVVLVYIISVTITLDLIMKAIVMVYNS